jgi:putative transposase
MSVHSFSRCWLHLTWATLNRQRVLPKPAAVKVSEYLHEYAESKGIFMRINYVNPDHTHALIDLPTKYAIEEVMKLLKGASSHWINANRVVNGKFAWGRGYGAFSVSHSQVSTVVKYIANQEAHHQKKSLADELAAFVRAYGLEWRDDEWQESEIQEGA